MRHKLQSSPYFLKSGKTVIRLSFVLLLIMFLCSSLSNKGSEASAVYSFGAVGDLGATVYTGRVLDQVTPQGLNFFLALGDFSYNNVTPESSWCNFVKARVGNNFPFTLLAGNHEDDGPDGLIANFASCLPNRMGNIVGTYAKQFSFDYPQSNPSTRFILISPNLTFPGESTYSYSRGSTRYNWVAARIDNARKSGIKWIVVAMHKYCIAMVSGNCEVGPDIMNLLIEKRVDIVLQAHDHAYYRSKQLRFNAQCPAVVPNSYNAACVVDDGNDNQYIRGAGTVIMTVGSGGAPINKVFPTDTEGGYFIRWMGNNYDPTHGYMKFTVSDNQISASFIRGSGGSFIDNFVIVRP